MAEQGHAAEESIVRGGVRLVRELISLHPGPFTVAVTGAAVYAAATVGSTVVLGRITDQVLYPTFDEGQIPDGALPMAVLAVLAVTFLRVSGVVTRRYFAGMTSERSQRSLRHRLTDQYLGLPMSWHQRTPTGQLLAHADNDTEVATELLHPLPFSLGVAFLAVFSSISLIVIDVWLALVAFLIFPALTVLNRIYSRRVEGPSANVQASVGRVSATAHESFDGALIVKTLGRAEAEGVRFAEAANRLRANRVVVGYIRAVFESIMDALPSLGIVLVVVFGSFRIDAGAITRGDLVQVAALFTVLALPMRVLGFFLEMIPPSVVSRRRLNMVLNERAPEQATEPVDLPTGPLSLEVDQLRFTYPGTDDPVLHGVSFTVEPGEVVALVGSTGSGKSTLCQLASGLIPPTSGSVRVGGRPMESLPDRQRTDAVSLVFQESFLFADTLRANIDPTDLANVDPTDLANVDEADAKHLEPGPNGRTNGATTTGTATRTPANGATATRTPANTATSTSTSTAISTTIEQVAGIAQVNDFVSDLPAGYDTVVGERGVTLSGGQRQRVALARALIRRPRLLLLDDATSAVDPKIEQRILAGLREGSALGQAAPTSLIVAQRVSTIKLADRVLYLADGRIAGDGTHDQLMELPGYAALVRAYEQAGASS